MLLHPKTEEEEKLLKLLYFIFIWMMMMAIRIICMMMMIISRPPCEPLTRLKGRKFWDQLAPACSLDRSSWEVFSFDRLLRNIFGDLHLILTVAWQYLSVASDHDLFKFDRKNHQINLWRFYYECDLSNYYVLDYLAAAEDVYKCQRGCDNIIKARWW